MIAGGEGGLWVEKEGVEGCLPVVLESEEVAGKGFAGVRWISGEEGARRWRSPVGLSGGEWVQELRRSEVELVVWLIGEMDG